MSILNRASRVLVSRMAAAVAALALLSVSAQAEDYRLQPGDVVDFSVVSYPDLHKRAVVDDNGSIVLPVIGRMAIRDLTIAELRQRVIEGLARRSIPRLLNDGTENWTVFQADQIMVDIGEYRPVFVDGDIANPGAQTFRPGMTVRQVVAAGGGYQISRVRVDNPVLMTAELQGRYEVLRVKETQGKIEIAGIQSQLGGQKTVGLPDDADPTLATYTKQALQLAQSRLDAAYSDLEKERAALELTIAKANTRMEYLLEQQKTDRQGAKEDADELDRVKQLFGKGLIQITRVIDAQRAVLLSATRALQTNAEIAQLEREQGELARSLVKLDDQRRIDLMADLASRTSDLAQVQSEMDSLANQIIYAQGLRSDLLDGADRKPQISVTRTASGQTAQLDADPDTALLPGDSVTVSLRSEYTPRNTSSVVAP